METKTIYIVDFRHKEISAFDKQSGAKDYITEIVDKSLKQKMKSAFDEERATLHLMEIEASIKYTNEQIINYYQKGQFIKFENVFMDLSLELTKH